MNTLIRKFLSVAVAVMLIALVATPLTSSAIVMGHGFHGGLGFHHGFHRGFGGLFPFGGLGLGLGFGGLGLGLGGAFVNPLAWGTAIPVPVPAPLPYAYPGYPYGAAYAAPLWGGMWLDNPYTNNPYI